MFSVNIDKLVKMTPNEARSYADAVDAVFREGNENCLTLAVVGGGVSSFKLASSIMDRGKRILFIDADVHEDIFLSKYRLGKNLKGFTDYMINDEPADNLICVTNREQMDVIFTGSVENITIADLAPVKIKNMFIDWREEYDLIIVQSDIEGTVAACCDETVIIMQQQAYQKGIVQEKADELEKKGCCVLGVIIDE